MTLVPTHDNYHLSPPTAPGQAVPFSAINCTEPLPARVADYLRNSLSDNTRQAYRSDLEHFIAWGGRIPSTDVAIASYLADQAGDLSIATLCRRLVSISHAHQARALDSPTRSALVAATLRGIKRSHGVGQLQAKPLLKEDLFEALAVTGDSTLDVRDRALLLLGFAGGFRRSELVAIDCQDLEFVRDGMVVRIRRSKTDQVGAGRKVGIPLGRTRWCPVRELEEWLLRASIDRGPVFRRVDRHGRVLGERLSSSAIAIVVKRRVAAAGLDPVRYSGHSLRAGFVTSAAQAGVTSWKIRQQTGHRSDSMLNRYVRDGELFVNNGAGSLL